MKFRLSLSNATLGIIMVVMLAVSLNINWGKDHWKGLLEADAKGYYAYLPAVFIYQDLNFGFYDSMEGGKYYEERLAFSYLLTSNGHTINKYYCGTAIAEMPFFLVAHGIAHACGYDADGYSQPYPVMMSVAALFYLFLGLWYLNRTLSLYGIGEWNKALVLVVALFGTNLFYYTIGEPGMSHVFSFGFISMFVFYGKKYFRIYDTRHIPLLALLLGLIVLIRPTNGLVFFALPFLAGSLEHLKEGFTRALKKPILLSCSVLAALSIIFLQFLIYKISSGQFFVYSYVEEGFKFSDPHFFDILFSYRKGLFVYTPVYLVSFLGLFFLWRYRRFEFWSWFLFFVLITYVFSSWWMWFYGGSFSSRVFVEYIPLFMVLLAISLEGIKKKVYRTGFSILLIVLTLFCQLQTYQYRYGLIHWSDMTKEMYWDVFLRADKIR